MWESNPQGLPNTARAFARLAVEDSALLDLRQNFIQFRVYNLKFCYFSQKIDEQQCTRKLHARGTMRCASTWCTGGAHGPVTPRDKAGRETEVRRPRPFLAGTTETVPVQGDKNRLTALTACTHGARDPFYTRSSRGDQKGHARPETQASTGV